MKEKAAIGFMLIFLFLMPGIAINAVEAKPENEFVPNEMIVGVQDIRGSILSDIEENGGAILELIPSLNALRVSVDSAKEDDFIKAMKSKSGVRYVERNFILKAVHTPNDLYWDDQWGMRIIQADSAWDIHKGSTSVTVAIVDTGVEYTHDDLSGHYLALGYDWVNNDNDPMDDNGHGTHCAGITAAVMDNGIGVVGIAQVSLMAEKVLGADGSGTADDVAQGIVHAADAGAEVISISLGSYFSSGVIQDACQHAWNKGIILVAAAGNDDVPRKHYPAAYETVIAVAATDRYDGKASYSNWGDWIELSAPGGDSNDRILSTYLDNWYAWGYGTSMAAPHVSGLAALVWSYESSLTNQELREHLRNTADDLGAAGKDRYYGYGRINAYRALSDLGPTPAGNLEGYVTDSSTSLPIEGATVTVLGTTKSATTDEHGYYLITDIPVGGYDVEAEASGYQSQTKSTEITEGTTTTLDFSLDPTPSAGEMHVESIDFKQKGPRWLDIMVTIYDDAGSPVTEATVYMDITYPDGSVQPVSAVTNGNGIAKYQISRPAKGAYMVTVTNITHDTLTYDPDANKETTDSYTVT